MEQISNFSTDIFIWIYFWNTSFSKNMPYLSSSYGSQCKSNQQVSRSNVLAHIYILLVVLHKCDHAKPYLVVNVINGRKRANHVQTRSSLVQTDWLNLWFCKFRSYLHRRQHLKQTEHRGQFRNWLIGKTNFCDRYQYNR